MLIQLVPQGGDDGQVFRCVAVQLRRQDIDFTSKGLNGLVPLANGIAEVMHPLIKPLHVARRGTRAVYYVH